MLILDETYIRALSVGMKTEPGRIWCPRCGETVSVAFENIPSLEECPECHYACLPTLDAPASEEGEVVDVQF